MRKFVKFAKLVKKVLVHLGIKLHDNRKTYREMHQNLLDYNYLTVEENRNLK